MDKPLNEIIARCVACRKTFSMTDAQIAQANEEGCAISPCCNFPSSVEAVNRTRQRHTKGKK